MISSFPHDLGADDIEDFIILAKYYATRTPQSFRKVSRLDARTNLTRFLDIVSG